MIDEMKFSNLETMLKKSYATTDGLVFLLLLVVEGQAHFSLIATGGACHVKFGKRCFKQFIKQKLLKLTKAMQ